MHVQSDLSFLLFVVGSGLLFVLASLLLALLAAFVRLLAIRLLVGLLLLLAGLHGISHLQFKSQLSIGQSGLLHVLRYLKIAF